VILVAKTHTCSICKTIHNHLAQNIHNFDSLDSYQIYIDDIERFRGEYVVFSVPTIMIFSKGKELMRQSRFFDIDKINRLIAAYKA